MTFMGYILSLLFYLPYPKNQAAWLHLWYR